jgi:DNA-binding transcriptional regulator YdaS (Cro superfamily)
MTYKEAVAKFGSRRKLANALDISTQAVAYWAKNPDREIPSYRAIQIEYILKNDQV